MAGHGPPPNPSARRRNARPAQMTLPAEGRVGDAPVWPLPAEVKVQAALAVARDDAERLREEWAAASDPKETRSLARKLDAAERRVREIEIGSELARTAEGSLWAELWSTPQAVAWERLRWTREVAQYVRWKVKAEGGDLNASKEARMLADRLGLTPLALQNLHWVIGDVPAPAAAESPDNVVELFG